ncbi:dipeptide epimerase [Marinilabilia salmonicolor]|jgi:L-alanine-DL-glutamate epimerase-like enolase superfamily enzyme|uniref:Dipeptide epimerase n=1 Tax=Marinilabilia salmonicolor TaxID=989 RepID=A0A2T0XLN6_9BACT|nr:dipeptide epimerase [Marinilabilia salmonicolor]PRY99864.1 secreted protein [Marinilabilia salmonicolor]RCW37338.1 secreted protein [Marinilabilia salmonicolor]
MKLLKNRRDFIKTAGILAGSAAVLPALSNCQQPANRKTSTRGKTMVLKFKPYELQLKHVFTVAAGSRTTTPVMLTEIEYDGIVGYGEASMPPYLGESHESVKNFLSKVDLSRFKDPFLMEDILQYVEQIAPGNYAAKASVDIALHDLVGKLMGQPWYRIWGLNPAETPDTSFTIGIDKPEVVKAKTREAAPYNILKVKLGGGNDREMIQSVRSVTDKPICVDVNQGWKDRHEALELIHWLKEEGVVFVEQPMPKTAVDDLAWLAAESPLPIVADEALQTVADVRKAYGLYNGINIKLMKCGGIRAAHQMALAAKSLGMKVMLGCMTETSCAVTAAAQLSPMAHWADLDGNLLISNDVFDGLKVIDGRVVLPDRPGIGVVEV